VLARTDRTAASDGRTIEVMLDRRAPVILDPHEEGYELDISDDRVVVSAATPAGFRHGFVTLAQLLLDGLPSRTTVRDAPRYSWRGLHIDLARQWFEPSVIDGLIDRAAWLKLSRLHLHLTDDEGWRVPVDGYPDLGRVGGTRGHGLPLPPKLGGGPEPTGRCYTADEITGWNARAAALGVTLVPEVDLPAHVHAALTAVPDLRDPDDTSGAVSVQFFSDNVLVPGHEPTADFVAAVVASVCRLFPDSPWIHIGGDEVPDGAWSASPIVERFRADLGLTDDDGPEAQRRAVEAAFHRDLVGMVARHGRAIGAWQEAAESGGVRPGDGYVVGWRTIEANRTLARAGHDVVVSPGQAYYLDMAVDDRWETPGAAWAGSTSVADIVAFDPADGWTPQEREHLLGIQACLWTEFVHDTGAIDDRLTVRLDAIAEHAWTGSVIGGDASLTARATRLPSG
jgi:hexosaminidase